MPYRIDIARPPRDAFDRLVELGALDVELTDGGVAAILPDGLAREAVVSALGVARVAISPVVGRDDGSVWLLNPREVRIAGIRLIPVGVAGLEGDAANGLVRLTDSAAFGTGFHPTTALCAEAIDEICRVAMPESLLDVGTGSGVLALVALMKGVARVVGLDVDAGALRVAAEHAHLNGFDNRLRVMPGGPEAVEGAWPVVVANILAAPLIEMAPALVRRVGHHGQLVLSGISTAVAPDVEQSYRRLGMRLVRSEARAGWVVLVLQATW